MRFKKQIALFAILLLAIAVAWATPGAGIIFRSIITRAQAPGALHSEALGNDINGNKWHLQLKTEGAPSDFFVQETVWGPGGYTGWHSHPGPVLVTVKEGTASWYDANCVRTDYTPGMAFIEDAGANHNLRNESASENVRIVTIYIIPTGVATRIDEGQPPTCSLP